MSPRKVRLVIDMVRGLPARSAVEQLAFSPKEAARPVRKLIESAMANAEHNDKADLSKLRIAKIVADGGATLHRWRPRAHGRAAPIRKRTSHITVILSDESPADVHASQVKGGRKHRKTEAKTVPAPAKKEKKSEDATEGKKPFGKKPSKTSMETAKKSEKKPEEKEAASRRNDAMK
jgi:large subunit ribosomal protein L22